MECIGVYAGTSAQPDGFTRTPEAPVNREPFGDKGARLGYKVGEVQQHGNSLHLSGEYSSVFDLSQPI